MGTRATIEFKDRFDTFYVYRGHDGFPEFVLKDINEVIDAKNGSWSGSECCLLVTCFLGWHFDKDKRLPIYEITERWHSDESYGYTVNWNEESKRWVANVNKTIIWYNVGKTSKMAAYQRPESNGQKPI